MLYKSMPYSPTRTFCILRRLHPITRLPVLFHSSPLPSSSSTFSLPSSHFASLPLGYFSSFASPFAFPLCLLLSSPSLVFHSSLFPLPLTSPCHSSLPASLFSLRHPPHFPPFFSLRHFPACRLVIFLFAIRLFVVVVFLVLF